jgi:hypothetical protein
VAHHRAARDALRILGPDRILVLRYEDVVVEPEAAREALAGFLEVRPGPVALDERLLEAHPLFPARESWKARALEPVASDRIDAGKGLDPADASIVSSVCGPLLEEFGYEGPSVAVPPPRGESRERIAAFRRWHASVIAANDLPIY